jgi:heme A synthase
MRSHFLLLLVFSFFVALVFGALLRDDPREQIRFGALMFASLVGAAVVLGWLMYPFPL